MIAKEQDEALRNLFISQTNTSECVYMLIDSNNNYAVLTPEADDKSWVENPVYFMFSNSDMAQKVVDHGFEDCSVVTLDYQECMWLLRELNTDGMGIMLNPQAPDMMAEEYDSGDVYNELGEAWDMFED